MPEPGALGYIHKWASRISGLAFGGGLEWKVQEAYTFLMDHWKPGDRVFIFGFSRGAYTARVLGAMLHAIGLLPAGGTNMVPYALKLFKGDRDERAAGDGEDYETLCQQFRWSFARPMGPHDQDRRFPVHFVGVWDTVSSVGWVWDPERYRYTACNPGISTIRHAVSIDERRWFFRQNLFKQAGPVQDFRQIWFPGVHCDVGGGYPPTVDEKPDGPPSQLWRISFTWMLEEAKAAGLLINPDRLAAVVHPEPDEPRPWADLKHESLEGPWLLAEYFPKRVWNSKKQERVWAIGDCRYRSIPSGALIHRSALLRIRDAALKYAPPNMAADFLRRVRDLAEVPETLAYVSPSV
jgi:uncharacterized protein (DUF2235 family)